MAASSGFTVTWLWLLLIGGAIPLGGAPLPLDPVLSAIAPEECLWYAAYSGQGPASADSANQTEQLLAEPQVVRFVEAVQSELLQFVRRAAGPERQKQIVAEQAPKLVQALLSRPSAAYVERVEPLASGVDVEGAFILNAGDRRDEMKSALTELLKLLPPDGPQFTTETVAGVEWRRAPAMPRMPVVRWGWKDDYLIVAVGDATAAKLIERMSGATPEWLSHLRQEHPIERELSLGYLNVAGVLKIVRPIAEKNNPQVWSTVEKLRLTSIRAFHGRSGYDAAACKSIAHLVTDGSRTGLLALLPYQPLDKSSLQVVPKDALVAFAVNFDPSEAWENAVKLAAQFNPQAEEEIERGLREIKNQMGIDVLDDVVSSMGDAWVMYLPGGDLMNSWLNAAAAVKVKDSKKLSAAVDQFVDFAKAQMARHPGNGSITMTEIAAGKLYSLQFPAPAPVSPTWCVGDDWLVVGLSPQAVRSAMERQVDDSLAAAPVIERALTADGGAAVVGYQDTPQLVRSIYPWLQMGAQAASGALRQQGVEFDPSLLPSADVVVKHLQPSVAVWTHRDDGFLFTSEHSLPSGGNVVAGAPVAVALLLPAVQGARQSARQAQDLNDMKQLALACLMYHDVHTQFPGDVYSEDGQPLLSWRVKLLPYLEEQDLFDQFHLDEPWDSPHNKPLLARMPKALQSANDSAVADKTRYVALKGDDALFPGRDRISIKQITDGTSNTLLFVQAAPEEAVEWTRPADMEFDAEQPLAGLGSPAGFFLAAFCDGSCRQLSLGIGDETMKALVTRDDGEMIDQRVLEAPPAPNLYKRRVNAAQQLAPND